MTPVDRFKLLPKETQEAILDGQRDINVGDHHDWWDAVFDDFIEKMKDEGIEVLTRAERTHKGRTHKGRNYNRPAIFFRGFGSQGDGACFEGRVQDWNLVLTKHNFPLLVEHREEFDTLHFMWASSGMYCHEHTLSFSDEDTSPVYLDAFENKDEHELRRIARRDLHDQLVSEWERFTEYFAGEVRKFCRDLYSALEEEHEHLTSDEAVLDTLIANDMLDDLIKEHHDEHDEHESA